MSIEVGGVLSILRCFLVHDDLAGVIFVDVEAIFSEVDTESAHATCDIAPGPSVEYAATIGTKGDYVPKFF